MFDFSQRKMKQNCRLTSSKQPLHVERNADIGIVQHGFDAFQQHLDFTLPARDRIGQFSPRAIDSVRFDPGLSPRRSGTARFTEHRFSAVVQFGNRPDDASAQRASAATTG